MALLQEETEGRENEDPVSWPRHGETSRIISIIEEQYSDAENILVLSPTNATIDNLTDKLKDINAAKCYALHSYAMSINHLVHYHIIDADYEQAILKSFSANIDLDLKQLRYFLQCITFNDTIESCSDFLKSTPASASRT